MLLHDIDLPAIAPWRTGAAEAYLLLGRPQQARALAQEQSALARPRGERSGGLALRALAAASAPHERPALLEDAVELLQTSADQYELALALADLASAYHDIGESGDARAIERRAVHLKTLCRSESAPRESPSTMTAMTVPLPGPPEWSRVLLSMGTPQGEGSEAATDDLSDAERRVADLAARGLTNRQISAKLYVTVSTVEQHLTRIYRKLGVSRRVDLPTRLEPNLAGRRSA
jgi:DNA-binding CsgD family transcriptional regulator